MDLGTDIDDDALPEATEALVEGEPDKGLPHEAPRSESGVVS